MPVSTPEKPLKNEWYTPFKYIEAAREVLGTIDLDPASCAQANETVQAKRYFTIEDDGLKQQWGGKIYMNPPFGTATGHIWAGKSNIAAFLHKLIAEYKVGNVSEAISLVRADPGALWFRQLWEFPLCFLCEDPYFERPDSTPTRHRFGTAFVYLGPYEQAFINVFSRFGAVVRRVAPTI